MTQFNDADTKPSKGRVNDRLAELNMSLPDRSEPFALLMPYRRYGNVLKVSAQLPKQKDELVYRGKLGADLQLEDGIASAKLSALNILTHASHALDGDLDRVQAVLSLRGYVNCSPDFIEIAEVINGASLVMHDVFGIEIGGHTRTALGLASLPFGAATEVEAEFLVK